MGRATCPSVMLLSKALLEVAGALRAGEPETLGSKTYYYYVVVLVGLLWCVELVKKIASTSRASSVTL